MGQFKVLDRDISEGQPGDNRTARYYDMLTWGEISDPPKVSIRERDKTRRCSFSIRWKKHTFVNCVVIEKDSPGAYLAAQELRKGDTVLLAGRLREYTYTPTKGKRAGEQIQGQDAKVSVIIPQRLIGKLMESMSEGEPEDETDGLYIDEETGELEW